MQLSAFTQGDSTIRYVASKVNKDNGLDGIGHCAFYNSTSIVGTRDGRIVVTDNE